MTNKSKPSPRASRTRLPPKDQVEIGAAYVEEEDDDLKPNPNHLPVESDEGEETDTSVHIVTHNPNHNSESNSNEPTLYLTSFSHKRGPLHPKPTILIDLRTLPNPPKDLRATQTGLSKSLRGWLLQNTEFKKRFDEAVGKIEEVLLAREEVWNEKEEVRSKGKRENEDEEDRDEDEDKDVLVGVRCEMGRHRSVAFVEELSRYRWPKPWNVVVTHRDVDVERTKESMKGARRRRGKKWEDDAEY